MNVLSVLVDVEGFGVAPDSVEDEGQIGFVVVIDDFAVVFNRVAVGVAAAVVSRSHAVEALAHARNGGKVAAQSQAVIVAA